MAVSALYKNMFLLPRENALVFWPRLRYISLVPLPHSTHALCILIPFAGFWQRVFLGL